MTAGASTASDGTAGRAPAARNGSAERGTLLLAPAVVLVLLVLGTALSAMVLTSLGLMPLVGEPVLTAAAFGDVRAELVLGLRESLLIATASTVLAVLVGVPTALLLTHAGATRRLLGGLVASVLPVPHLIGAASIGLLLSGGGVLPRWLGVPVGDWPELVGGSLPTAIVLEFAWKESAFIALVVAASLSARLLALSEAAAMLGAGPWQRLRRVTLPLAAPATMAGATIVFLYTLGSYEVAWLLGRAYPDPLPVLAYRLFTSIDLADRPQAAAAALVTIGIAVGVAAIAVPVMRRLGAAR